MSDTKNSEWNIESRIANSQSNWTQAIFEIHDWVIQNITDTLNHENEKIRKYNEREVLLKKEIEKITIMTESYTDLKQIPWYVKNLLNQYDFFLPWENETPRCFEALKSANLLRLKIDELNSYFNGITHNINWVSQEIISQWKRLNKNQYTIDKEVIISILDSQRWRKIMAENSDSLNSRMWYCAPLM